MGKLVFVNPKTMPAPRGYTQVVETTGPGRTVYLSGQLGMTPGGAFAGAPGDFRAQATQCFENLKAGLASAGGSFEHVVKLTNFFVDMAHLLGSLPRIAPTPMLTLGSRKCTGFNCAWQSVICRKDTLPNRGAA